jgi:hypothetical protein
MAATAKTAIKSMFVPLVIPCCAKDAVAAFVEVGAKAGTLTLEGEETSLYHCAPLVESDPMMSDKSKFIFAPHKN